jgi:thiol-disulfide isomerase/thioredoxin
LTIHSLALVAGLFLLAPCALVVEADAPPLAPQTPIIKISDVNGAVYTPLSQPNIKATVLLFVLPDCPISNSYAPQIKRLVADYEPKKISVFVVHVDPDVTAEAAKKHAKEYDLTCPILLDPSHLLVKHTGVTIAPEAAVVGADGKLLYRGRIDDWYVDLGKRRAEPTKRDLRDALDAILQGNAVATPRTTAFGCYLPPPRQ